MTGAFSLPTAITGALAMAIVLASMLAYVSALSDTNRALRLWFLAYFAYALRQAFNLAVIDGRPELQPFAEGSFIIAAVLLLAGTLRFTGQHVPTAPLASVAAATLAWIGASHVAGLSFFWQAAPPFLVGGSILLLAAAVFRRQQKIEPGVGHGMVAALFLLLGLHMLNYPFLRPVAWIAPFGFLLSTNLILGVGLGLLITSQRRQQLLAEAATARLRRSEARLRESEARFRNMADTMPALLYMTDADGHCRFVNKTMLDFTGRRLEDELGDGWLSNVHPEDLHIVTDQERAAFDARQAYSFKLRLISASGEARWFLDSGVPRFGPDGTFLGYIGTLTDITEQMALAEQLQQAQKMEAIGQLTGGIAHDFNNLLAIILGNLDLLDERLPAESGLRGLVRDSLRAAERGAELTGRLLGFSRRRPLKPDLVDVNRLVAGMTGMLRRTLGSGIRIDTVLAGNLGPVLVDAGQLESALLNLAINARDAMPDGGRLTLRTAAVTIPAEADPRAGPAPGDYVEIVMIDTGTGMTPDVLARVFEPYFTTKRPGHGTGLGLIMVYGLVSQSGGHISIDSAPGEGTIVRLLLPRAAAEQPEPTRTAADPANDAGTGELVLLVEDEPDVRRLAARLLGELGYRLLEAGDGPAALAILAEQPHIDLMLTDVVLPHGMSGIELARRARELRPGLPVLFMTGYAEGVPAAGGAEIDLLQKPFRKTELAVRLRRALATPVAPVAAAAAGGSGWS